MKELNGSNGVIANTLTGLNIDEYFVRTEPGCCGPLSYLNDALGSTSALTDSSGTVQNQYQYEPFGNAFTPVYNNTSTNSYQFTGRENDGEGGYDLYYYRGRYYSPVFQRFISEDPFDFSGGDTNLYGYVGQTPTDLTDPLGLYFAELYSGYGAAIGGSLTTLGSVGVDAATGGLNIPVTPEEVWAGVAGGGATGYAIGSVLDYVFQRNRIEPDPRAQGPHCGFRRQPGGQIGHYMEFDAQGRPIKRFRGQGKPHHTLQPPLVYEPPNQTAR